MLRLGFASNLFKKMLFYLISGSAAPLPYDSGHPANCRRSLERLPAALLKGMAREAVRDAVPNPNCVTTLPGTAPTYRR
jgi:hypothetical protein